jgi:hypothetical protein
VEEEDTTAHQAMAVDMEEATVTRVVVQVAPLGGKFHQVSISTNRRTANFSHFLHTNRFSRSNGIF